MKKVATVAILSSVLSLSACVYHRPFEQGNILTPSKVQSIHNGMTSEAVITVLGSPVLKNVYKENQVDYVYENVPNGKTFSVKKVTVSFKNDRVVSVHAE